MGQKKPFFYNTRCNRTGTSKVGCKNGCQCRLEDAEFHSQNLSELLHLPAKEKYKMQKTNVLTMIIQNLCILNNFTEK